MYINLEIHLSESCNLNCSACCHFAQIAEEEYLSPQEHEKNLSSIDNNVLNYFSVINLLGGEPLKNKDIIEIMRITRKYYTKDIKIITNGLLIRDMPEDFFEACIENDIEIAFSKYPIRIDYDGLINEFRQKYKGLRIGYYNTETTFYHHKFDIYRSQDYKHNFSICSITTWQHYFQLVGTHLHICCYSAYIRHFNKRFGYNMKDDEYLDKKDVSSVRQIDEWAKTPKLFCGHCMINKVVKEPWRRYDGIENEYIL